MFYQSIVNRQIKLWSIFVLVNKCQYYECSFALLKKRNVNPVTRCCEVMLKL